MSERLAKLAVTATLSRAVRLLAERASHLEAQVQAGDEVAWNAYTETVMTLASLIPALAPDHGELLTTAEMAARLGITSKTLLKRKGRGQVRPALQAGKLIRWRGTEQVSSGP